MPPLSGLFNKRKDDKAKSRGKGKEKPLSAPMPDAAAPALLPGDGIALPSREVVRPPKQLSLSEAELNEEVAKMLTATNPAAPQNVARFSSKERCYKFEPIVEQLVVAYSADGWLLHKGSEEARKQQEAEQNKAEAAARAAAELERAAAHDAGAGGRDADAAEPADGAAASAAPSASAAAAAAAPGGGRALRNQFNFSDRAAQTSSYPLRDRGTATEPPPTATASGSCSAWEMFDEYRRDLEQQRMEEAAKQKGGAKKPAAQPAATPAAAAAGPAASAAACSGSSSAGGCSSSGGKAAGSSSDAGGQQAWSCSESLLDGLRILERMANQNSFADVASDFKYWDDIADVLRPGEGSLLPLWQFKCDAGKRKHVTSLCWSSLYADQFAVGYGSFHYAKQGGGAVAIFSLKNPSHPELITSTESGVMALHFHPTLPHLLAVGCYDGSVRVYDVRCHSNAPLYRASPKARRHTDPVWQIVWQPEELQKSLSFVSISTDGEVLLWTLAKAELLPELLMRLHAPADKPAAPAAPAAAAEPAPSKRAVGGLCIDFCNAPGQEHVYLVGSEEGAIHRCSKAYGSDYLASYGGHSLPVYAVRWNTLHPGLFLSCSADWSVKVWDVQQQSVPLLSFQLGAAVGDVAWAPYSSTVFAAVTDEGRVHVYDLAQNRQLPLCAQKCAKKARLTRVAFNPRHPVLLVGDSKGGVAALKLSPNLRRCCVRPEGGSSAKPGPTKEELERAKLDEVIRVARKSQAPVPAAAPREAAAV